MNRASSAERADEADLLGQHGEDEVGLLLRQEAQLALRALQEALAPDAARAERDLRLDDVVAGAERIALGVEEGEHPLLLVVVQLLPEQRQGQRASAPSTSANFHQRTPARNSSPAPPPAAA